MNKILLLATSVFACLNINKALAQGAITYVDFCASVENNPVLTKFTKYYEFGISNNLLRNFDPSGLARKWYRGKFPSGDMNARRIINSWVNNCAYQLIKKDSANYYRFIGDEFNRRYNISGYQELAKINVPRIIKKFDSNGNVVEEHVGEQAINWDNHMPDTMRLNGIDVVYASFLVFNGGDKVIEALSNEYFTILDKEVERIKAEAEATARARKMEEERIAAAKIAAMNNRHSAYKAGKYSHAKSCLDIANAIAVQKDFRPSESPINNFIYTKANIKKISSTNSAYNMYIKDDKNFGMLRYTSNTLALNTKSFAVNDNVCVLGKYVRNNKVNLSNGTSQVIVDVDAVCIQHLDECTKDLDDK
jgi:hypothetical protein